MGIKKTELATTIEITEKNPRSPIFNGIFKIKDVESGAEKQFRFSVQRFGTPNFQCTLWLNENVFLSWGMEQKMQDEVTLKTIVRTFFMMTFLAIEDRHYRKVKTPPISVKESQNLLKFLSE